MKNNISEELSYSKYLLNYKRGLVISEQASVTTPVTTEPTEPSVEQKTKEEITLDDQIETYSNMVCDELKNLDSGTKTFSNASERCKSCSDMLQLIKTGNAKKKQIQDCLQCENMKTKQFVADESSKLNPYLYCKNLAGKIEALSLSLSSQSQKKGAREQATMWTALGSSLLMLYKEIKSLFQKEGNQM